jgi:hypothetical protein
MRRRHEAELQGRALSAAGRLAEYDTALDLGMADDLAALRGWATSPEPPEDLELAVKAVEHLLRQLDETGITISLGGDEVFIGLLPDHEPDPDWAPKVRAPLRFFDGPFTAPEPSGPAHITDPLLREVPQVARVLAEDEPGIPARRDWSWRGEARDPRSFMSHWESWDRDDTATVERAWRRAGSDGDAAVQDLVEQWSWQWPDLAGRSLHAHHPAAVEALVAGHDSDPRFSLKRHAHREAWLDTALHVGLHELYRTRIVWPDPEATTCGVCGRLFAPETLSHWMRQYGPPRYCPACCCRARDGRPTATRDEVIEAVQTTCRALGFIPPSNIAAKADLNALPLDRRDAAMAALVCLPPATVCSDAVGAAAGSNRWLQVLLAAGVVDRAWRQSRGTFCVAADGHPCRSLGEASIDDFLSSSGIGHEPEPVWPVHPALNPHGRLRADWLLDDGTYVEYAGLLGNAEYAEKIASKQRLAREAGLTLLIVTPEDLSRLHEVFRGAQPRP